MLPRMPWEFVCFRRELADTENIETSKYLRCGNCTEDYPIHDGVVLFDKNWCLKSEVFQLNGKGSKKPSLILMTLMNQK